MKNIILFFIVLYFTIYILNSCSNKRSASSESVYASLSDSTSYAGMQACRQCHEDKYQSFIRTGMGLSFDTASKKKSHAVFDHALIADHIRNFYYTPYWSGNEMHVKEFRLEGRDSIYERTEK